MADHQYPAFRDHYGIYPLGELASRAAEKFGKLTALQWWSGQGYEGITYNELSSRVDAVARWLIETGIKPDDRVAIYAENSPEWGIVYLAIQRAGAVGVPIDRSLPTSGVVNILRHSETRLLFSQKNYLTGLDEEPDTPDLLARISFDTCDMEDMFDFNQIQKEGEGLTCSFPERNLEDKAVIIYTSGTTGHSKGVVLNQRNISSNVAASAQLTDCGPGDGILVLLPMSHALQCTNGFLHPLYIGMTLTFARRLRSAEIIADIREAKITLMGSVPIMYEKMHQKMIAEVRKKNILVRFLFQLMMGLAAIGATLRLPLGRILFSGIRKRGGLGSIRYFITGGAAIDPKTSRFFKLLGIPMMQGYGLTETSPVTHFSPPWSRRPECVGLPVPGVHARIADPGPDGVGEICIKGPNVFTGYHKDPTATSAVIDNEGWFYTGDLGIIHRDGYLQITGRKKNVIVTGGGKNVYPEEVEHHLNRCSYIAESLVMGIPRGVTSGEEVAALVLPDHESLTEHFGNEDTIPKDKDLLRFIREEAQDFLRDMPEYARVRTYGLVSEPFEKTTTMKIKRYIYSGRFNDLAMTIL